MRQWDINIPLICKQANDCISCNEWTQTKKETSAFLCSLISLSHMMCFETSETHSRRDCTTYLTTLNSILCDMFSSYQDCCCLFVGHPLHNEENILTGVCVVENYIVKIVKLLFSSDRVITFIMPGPAVSDLRKGYIRPRAWILLLLDLLTFVIIIIFVLKNPLNII